MTDMPLSFLEFLFPFTISFSTNILANFSTILHNNTFRDGLWIFFTHTHTHTHTHTMCVRACVHACVCVCVCVYACVRGWCPRLTWKHATTKLFVFLLSCGSIYNNILKCIILWVKGCIRILRIFILKLQFSHYWKWF